MVADLNNFKNKAQIENTELTSQLEEAESKINSLTKAKNSLQAQLDETKQELEAENKVHSLWVILKSMLRCTHTHDAYWIVLMSSVGKTGCHFQAKASWGRSSQRTGIYWGRAGQQSRVAEATSKCQEWGCQLEEQIRIWSHASHWRAWRCQVCVFSFVLYLELNYKSHNYHRRKLQAKLNEAEEALRNLESKYSSLDKTKARIAAELEDVNLDLEKVDWT